MAELTSDTDGFLTGPRIDDKALSSDLDDIRDSLDTIEASVKSIERAIMRAGVQTARGLEKREARTPGNERTHTKQPITPTAENRPKGERGGGSATGAARRHPVSPDGSNGNTTEAAPQVKPQSRAAANGPRTSASRKTAEARDSHDSHKPTAGARGASPRLRAAAPNVRTEKAATGVTNPSTGNAKPATPRARKAAQAESETPKRDAKGRFIGKGGKGDGGFFSGSEAGREERSAALLAGKIADAVVDGTESLGDADPTVQAINEVAAPVSRGFGFLKDAWGDNGDEGWLRKIWKSLGKFQKDQSAFNAAEKKQLKAIASNTEGIEDIQGNGEGNGGGLFGGMSGVLAKATPVLMGLGKRIPIIGAALAGLTGIFGIFDSEGDANLTRAEKDQKTGKAIGGAAGTIAGGFGGMKAGALLGSFAGPVGTAIGGVVGGIAGMWFGDKAGDIVGETVGGWVTSLREADIPGAIKGAWASVTASISAAWTSVTTSISTAWTSVTTTVRETWTGVTNSISEAWTSVTTSISDAWGGLTESLRASWDAVMEPLTGFFDKAKKGLSESLTGLNDWLKEKTGVDIGGAVSDMAASVSGAFSSAVDKAQKLFGKSESKSENPYSRTYESKRGPTTHVSADGWQLGQTSSYFESGGRGAGVISSGRGDHGGKSYGTYQLSSRAGTLQDFVKNGGYSDKLTAKVGTAEFDEQWKDLAKNDPAFAQAQHDYIKRTHYDRAASNLAMNGIDLSARGKAVQDMLWSTSVQFGAGDSMSGGTGLIRKALAGRDASNMSDAEIIEAVQNYKLANNDRLFASSSEGVRKGTARRAALEKERLLKLNGFENGAQNPAAKQVAQSAGLVAPEKERSESDPEKAQADAQAKMLFAGTLDKTKTEAANLDPLHRSFVKDLKGAPKDFRPTVENSEKIAERHKERRSEAMEILHSQRRAAAEAKIRETEGVSEAYARRASERAAKDNFEASRPGKLRNSLVFVRNPEPAQSAVAHTPRLAMPPAPAVPPPPPAPAMKAPLASNDKQGAVTVRLQNETPQDVKDRSIALVATGGYSGTD